VSKTSDISKPALKLSGIWTGLKGNFIRSIAVLSVLLSVNAPVLAGDNDETEMNMTQQQMEVHEQQPDGRAQAKPEWEDAGDPDSKDNAAPKKSKYMIQGSVNYLVPKGTPFKLKLASVPTHGDALKLADRDLDGNLYPAKLGQVITARTSEDLYIDDNKVIPEGTVFHGVVSELEAARRVNRNGWLKIEFNSLTTPDGRDFAFTANADNFKKSTAKTKLKGAAYVASYSAGGAIVGALVAYQLFGLHNTIAMHGYNIAGGAAGGALLATCYAVMKHGRAATLEPGDDLNMNFDADLLMPAATDPTIKKAQLNKKGVDVKILKAKLLRDGLSGKILRVEANIENSTPEPLNSIDLFCEDTNGTRLPLVGGAEVDDSSSFMFTVEPYSRQHIVLNFLVEYPKLKRTLVWLDHDSRQVCYRAAIP
jgi:hypothetical protein